jgi:hypothetical protein
MVIKFLLEPKQFQIVKVFLRKNGVKYGTVEGITTRRGREVVILRECKPQEPDFFFPISKCIFTKKQ